MDMSRRLPVIAGEEKGEAQLDSSRKSEEVGPLTGELGWRGSSELAVHKVTKQRVQLHQSHVVLENSAIPIGRFRPGAATPSWIWSSRSFFSSRAAQLRPEIATWHRVGPSENGHEYWLSEPVTTMRCIV
jgi:hypothetical protein